MVWRLARSLDDLRRQVNTIAPARSKAADGTIGDTAHAARVSDHNPGSDGIVRALDLTDDPRGGLDAVWLREALRESRDPRIKYLISEGEICNSRRVGSFPAWAWRPYTGPNGHFHHLHISVLPGPAGDLGGPWDLARDFGAPVRPPITPDPPATPADQPAPLEALIGDDTMRPFLITDGKDQQYVAYLPHRNRFVPLSEGEVTLLRVKLGVPLQTLTPGQRDAILAIGKR